MEFFISGHGFAKFDRTLRQFLGISCLSKNRYYEVIKVIYPCITDILDGMCDKGKGRMKVQAPEVLGSWKKAVVTSDGMLVDNCHKQAKVEGCIVDTVWQDGDSSPAESVTAPHPTAKVYKCGDHVGRAFTNSLKEVAKKKEFS